LDRLRYIPRGRELPKRKTRGFGTMIKVGPEYSTRRGSVPTNDSAILTDHLRSRTSSINPRRRMKQMAKRAAL
jgi:hypothetical protein